MAISVRVMTDMPASRQSDLCLGLQDDSVFVDFSKDSQGILSLLRISYDGYGCNNGVENVGPLSAESSNTLLAAARNGHIDSPAVHAILLEYFDQNKTYLWEDALRKHSLVK